MATPKELLDECKKQYDLLKSNNPILKDIFRIIDEIEEKPFEQWSVTELSIKAGEISMLMVNLGDIAGDVKFLYKASYTNRKSKEAEVFLKNRKTSDTVTETENKTKIDMLDIRQEENKNEYYSDKLNTLYRSLDRIVSVIQSRMKAYDTEKTQANLSDNIING